MDDMRDKLLADRKEVLIMCNLSQGIKEESFNEGKIRTVIELVRKGRLSVEEAAEEANMTVEQFKKVMENSPT